MNTNYEPVPLTADTINEDGVAYALYQEPLTDEWFVELIDISNRGIDGYVVTLLDEERLYSSWNAAHTAAYRLNTELES